MARKRGSSSRKSQRRSGRVPLTDARRSLPRALVSLSRLDQRVPSRMGIDVIGRKVYMEATRPLSRSRIVRAVREPVSSTLPGSFKPVHGVFSFSNVLKPSLLTCAKRRVRKEVIHALGVAGSRGVRGPRYSSKSSEKCS